jgi:glycosyltransferase involved in cell wall biosynthesis
MITGMGSLFLPGGLKKRLLLSIVRAIYRVAMRCNHSVLFQNDEDLDYFVEHRLIASGKARRINGSGVNLEKFSNGGEEVQKGFFLLISRMIREKGVFEFVEAARSVKQTNPQARFMLLGPIDNNPGAITREQILSWEGEGVIEYAGVQSDVRPFLATSEVYVLPTYYLEGVPRSILEALAMGKPIITTDWRGCRDTVMPEVNGFLVPPKDAGALASSMRAFLDDPNLSSQMGKASRKLAEDKFDVTLVNATVIDELISNFVTEHFHHSQCGSHGIDSQPGGPQYLNRPRR